MSSTPAEGVNVLGHWHAAACLVARHPNPGTWETGGFPWCTCPERHPERGKAELMDATGGACDCTCPISGSHDWDCAVYGPPLEPDDVVIGPSFNRPLACCPECGFDQQEHARGCSLCRCHGTGQVMASAAGTMDACPACCLIRPYTASSTKRQMSGDG